MLRPIRLERLRRRLLVLLTFKAAATPGEPPARAILVEDPILPPFPSIRKTSEFGVRHPRELSLNQPNIIPLPPCASVTEKLPEADNRSFKVRTGIAFANVAGVTDLCTHPPTSPAASARHPKSCRTIARVSGSSRFR
jgi:hypothetical protein